MAQVPAQETTVKQDIAQRMARTRSETWRLIEGLPDDLFAQAVTDFLSPPSWDLGHIANFEELWLVQRLGDRPEMHAGYNDTYNAFEHPRAERPALHLLDRPGVRAYMDAVRAAALDVLASLDLDADRLTASGFVHRMIDNHEQQHQETLLQSLTLRADQGRYTPWDADPVPPVRAASGPMWCHVAAGPFTMGTTPGPGVYDNESPAHEVDVAAFDIARMPVTNGQYLRFIEDGGYDDDQWWSERGRQWLTEEPHHAPLHWHFDGQWSRGGMRPRTPVVDVADEILCHVTFFEAEAYAAWAATQGDDTAGARLPSEAEWEKACRWGPQGTGARNPWGDEASSKHSNIHHAQHGPGRIGDRPEGVTAVGAMHMVGDVWEWCSDGFAPYPGFEAFPYDEYSKVFFGGDYRMLRGGAWATGPGYATGTSRNWDHPYRRQIFSGIRLARFA